jgi:hypothetical protein
MDISVIIGISCTLGITLQCIQSCYTFFSLNSIYDRLDLLEQITWSQRTSNPIQNTNTNTLENTTQNTNTSCIQRTEDPI